MHFVRRPFKFPDALDQALRNQFWGGGVPNAAALKPFVRGLSDLWPQLAQGRGQTTVKPGAEVSNHYSVRQPSAEAYAAYYLPANAMKLPLVLEEAARFGVPLISGDATPLRWLDVGSGPGTALWGLAWWAKQRLLSFEFMGLEQSSQFLKLAEPLSRKLMATLELKAKVQWEAFRHVGAVSGGRSLSERIIAVRPHVVSMMNSIGEMEPDPAKRNAWVAALVDGLAAVAQSEGKPRWLVLIEPGSKVATRELLLVRESLRARVDTRVWFPCLDGRPCGALERPDDWCHEEAAISFPDWMSQLGEGAGLRKEALLFSYLVVSVGVHPTVPEAWPGTGMRVVSQMMKEKGLTQCFLCTPGGKRKARVLDSRASAANERFTAAVRGQVFNDVSLDAKGDVQSFSDAEPLGLGAQQYDDATVFPQLR